MSGFEYVLAQQKVGARDHVQYLMCWTGIGPALTDDLEEAQRFESEQAAMDHPAFGFWLTFLKPCPVLGDQIAKPVAWLDAEIAATRRVQSGESATDGIQVFA